MSSRHRPLHTCGASTLAIAHSASEKAQSFNGPIGSTTRRVAKLASPLARVMQYQWLAILSFADDCILAVENVVEKMFPPSTYVFNRIDNLVQIIETFPAKFDDALDKAPEIVHQVVFFMITTLTHWESGSAREKDIMVDEAHGQAAETPQAEPGTDSMTVDSGTYEEEQEKGTEEKNMEKESREEEDQEVEKMKESSEETKVGKEEAGKGEENADKSKKDPILELFESGWLMNPAKG
ncbi:uncharacterized protein LOC132179978 [Corylus avellana]|uniref:uncharacterized protein LOC132179978 n=1 Tax=Corylus avellana TaxID=13451 RepID=UPI00286B7970|nr:uncharacterized protein LOC132179978 [Corylus avellana]